jgi:hypothetical protein
MKSKMAPVIKNVIQVLVVVALGYLVRHKVAATHSPAWEAAGWLLSAWVAVRIGLAIRRGFARFREHTQTGVNLENLDKLTTASMQPWARGYYQMEKRAYRGFWRTLSGKPLAAAGTFSVAGGPRGRVAAAVLLLLVAACAVVGAIYLPDLVTSFWPRLFALAGAGYALLYAAIWIIGDRRNLREGGHSITRDELILDVGLRCAGAVALSSIVACRVTQEHTGRDVWTVSPGEKTNVLIELDAVTTLAITASGAPREISKRFIALYVDQPGEFAAALARARAGTLQVASALGG